MHDHGGTRDAAFGNGFVITIQPWKNDHLNKKIWVHHLRKNHAQLVFEGSAIRFDPSSMIFVRGSRFALSAHQVNDDGEGVDNGLMYGDALSGKVKALKLPLPARFGPHGWYLLGLDTSGRYAYLRIKTGVAVYRLEAS